MARIPTASRESVPQDQLAAFDEMVSQRGSVPDIGPISIMINVPELAKRGEQFRAYIRGDESSLPANVRELAMILTAREMNCQFIWNAHAAFGRQSGLSKDWLTTCATRKTSPRCLLKSQRSSNTDENYSGPARLVKPTTTRPSPCSAFAAWWN